MTLFFTVIGYNIRIFLKGIIGYLMGEKFKFHLWFPET